MLLAAMTCMKGMIDKGAADQDYLEQMLFLTYLPVPGGSMTVKIQRAV